MISSLWLHHPQWYLKHWYFFNRIPTNTCNCLCVSYRIWASILVMNLSVPL